MVLTDTVKNVLKRLGTAVLCIAVISYTIFHMVSLFSNELSTVVVRSTTENTFLELNGYVFRDETVVYSKYGGAVDYDVADGVRLSGGQAYATVYEEGNNLNAIDTIDELDRRIRVIEEAVSSKDTLSRLPMINQNIQNEYQSIMKKFAEGYIRDLNSEVEDITTEMGRASLLTNEETPLPNTLSYLKSEKERVLAIGGASETLVSARSGYFYSEVDGYEGIFTLAAAENMTPDLYKKYTTLQPSAVNNGGYAVGKMVYDSLWRFVTVVSQKEASVFAEGMEYTTVFNGSVEVTIPLFLEKIVDDEDSSSVVLVFSSDRLPDNFDFSRFQSAEMVTESITGINVPKSATHRSEGRICVYVLKGSVVFERELDIVGEGSDYYTVKDGLDREERDVYLQSNDTLILEGKNLFDGRILD